MDERNLPRRKHLAHPSSVERDNRPVILFVTLTVQPRGNFLGVGEVSCGVSWRMRRCGCVAGGAVCDHAGSCASVLCAGTVSCGSGAAVGRYFKRCVTMRLAGAARGDTRPPVPVPGMGVDRRPFLGGGRLIFGIRRCVTGISITGSGCTCGRIPCARGWSPMPTHGRSKGRFIRCGGRARVSGGSGRPAVQGMALRLAGTLALQYAGTGVDEHWRASVLTSRNVESEGEKCGRTESATPQAAGASAVDPYYLLPLTRTYCARISRLPAQRPSASPLQDRSRRSHPVIGWSSRARLRCGSRRGCRRVQGAAPFDP